MTQTKPQEAVRPKKLKNLTFYRNTQMFISWVQTLKEQKADFSVIHSKYTTALKLPDGSKINFILNRYRDKVFIANRMVVNDLKKNPDYDRIKQTEHSKNNFSVKNGLETEYIGDVINLDISSAYATTMYAQGLITEKTFNMLQSLEKHERLPAMGMLAKRALVYEYKEGECADTNLELGENRQIFFFLIQKVEECINKCREISGDYYLFHWVDGIFIRNDIPVKDLQRIERTLENYGYKYKYEKVVNLSVKRQKEILSIAMNKNGEDKEYKFNDPNHQTNFENLVQCLQDLEVSQAEDRLPQNGTSTSVLEQPRSNGEVDYQEWLATS